MNAAGRRVLMVAFHFPPFAGSSGVQRTLRFVQHLPAFGWQAIVLSAHPRAYEATGDDLMREVPPDTHVERAFALDTARHLSIANRYPAALARPDRWISWRWGAVAAGLRLIERFKPAAIWSTYPIATALVIGRELQRRSRLPWIADFRDPMVQEGYPADPATWRVFNTIENDVMRRAARVVFCTPGAARVYGARYPTLDTERIRVIENGFDEESFAGVDSEAAQAGPLNPGRITLLHSGVVYTSERDPTHLFRALGVVKWNGALGTRDIVLRFRASSNDALLRSLARANGVEEMLELLPARPHRDSLIEMMRADGLLVLQAANCNEQIPGKVYEYLRARRPILGLTDPRGDTAQLIRRAGVEDIVPLDDDAAIAKAIAAWCGALQRGTAAVPLEPFVRTNTRFARAQELAQLLDATITRPLLANTAVEQAAHIASPIPHE
jgi:glycosyltransferase involved in cell wall biosynthesis